MCRPLSMHLSCLILLITPARRYFYYHYSIEEKKLEVKKLNNMVVGKWQSLKWNPDGLDWEAPSCPLGLAALTHLSLILVLLPRVPSLFSNLEDLSESSACFGRINKAKCLSGVAASEYRSDVMVFVHLKDHSGCKMEKESERIRRGWGEAIRMLQ